MSSEFDIAIIGMAGRFPGADNVNEYWQNLANGVESITFFSDDDLREAGIDEDTINNPNYIKAAPVLKESPAKFDASFFGYSPREAQTMDPQQRLFLECAWDALEHAGYDAQQMKASVGVFGGAAMNTYFMYSGLIPRFSTDYLPTLIGNDNSFLTTRVSYKLNLTGPSVTVQTACSTGLVAVHTAAQNLINQECDVALAGAVSVKVPHTNGYLYEEGSVQTPDGHCRTFDAGAQGTIFGSGVGFVVLKRLSDAVEDGDTIFAVVKGSAINNDGSSKIDYTAPSVSAQSEVITEAMAAADITADSVSYIEAHGTGTFLGDPIEISALTKAYEKDTDKKGYCAIGSVKTNIGHLDAAAGIAGLIKTALALQNKKIPPSLHFESPNPQIDFANSPFYVNTELADWETPNGQPRRAGITALGIGGTNAHVILEEAPVTTPSDSTDRMQVIPLSARSKDALDNATQNLAKHIKANPDQNLADVAHTLQVGRKKFNHRRIVVAKDGQDAVEALSDKSRWVDMVQESANREIVFMFSGQGSQYLNMGRDLYNSVPMFKDTVDECAEILEDHLDLDIRDLMFPSEENAESAAQEINQTYITQPALFTIEFALAEMLMDWGIEPSALVGHSIGEYVAACVAGVLELEDALELVATRGRLMQSLPKGSMLAVLQPEAEVTQHINGKLSMAVINGDSLCVVAGEDQDVDALETKLSGQQLNVRRLRTSHAFHSKMMDPILDEFTAAVAQFELNEPEIPFVSNVTGTWITNAQATDPSYWANHLRNTVRFNDCLGTLLEVEDRILVEIGPSNTLANLAKQHAAKTKAHTILATTRHPKDTTADDVFALQTLGQLWMADAPIDWSNYHDGEVCHRVPLPTYPFERKEHWFKPKQQPQTAAVAAPAPTQGVARRTDLSDWFYIPSWKRSSLPKSAGITGQEHWLILIDSNDTGSQLATHLLGLGHKVSLVEAGSEFSQIDNQLTINPAAQADYTTLLNSLESQPDKIVHLWNMEGNAEDNAGNSGFFSLFFLAKALSEARYTNPIRLAVAARHMFDVLGGERVIAEKSTLLGPIRVMPKELANVRTLAIDFPAQHPDELVIDQILAEMFASHGDTEIAWRGRHRWVQTFENVQLPALKDQPVLQKDGVYLITGGFGGIGYAIAEHLAEQVQANIILVGRSPFPDREKWGEADAKTQAKIAQVQALEAHGAKVLALSGDVTNYDDMALAFSKTAQQFGPVTGVFHTAGAIEDGLISLKEAESAERVLNSKVAGTSVIYDLLQTQSGKFLTLFSSVNAILAPAGQVDYSAANSFMDAFALAHQSAPESAPNVFSISWPGWQDVGMVAQMPDSAWKKETLARGVGTAEGMLAIARVMAHEVPHAVVSPVNFLDEFEPINAPKTRFVSTAVAEASNESDQVDEVAPVALTGDSIYANHVQASIASIWEELLGVEQPAPDENFFDLGGSSLIALRLFADIEKLYDTRLPLATLFERPTIEQLAELFEGVVEEPAPAQITAEPSNQPAAAPAPAKTKGPIAIPWRSLVKIQRGSDTKLPLFLMHGAGGNVLIYRDLARHLGSDQTVYALQSVGINENEEPHTTIEQMAIHYAEEILQERPEGPYILGGYCMGGTVALETAQQLRSRGHEVALVAMFETYNWDCLKKDSKFEDAIFFIQKLDFHARNILMLDWSEKKLFFGEKFAELKRRIQMKTGRKSAPVETTELDPATQGAVDKLWKINDDAALEYVPDEYDGYMLQVRPKKGYRKYTHPGVNFETVNESNMHYETLPVYPAGMMVEPFVEQLAQELNKHINHVCAKEAEK